MLLNSMQMKPGKFVGASKKIDQTAEGLYPCYVGNGLRGYAKSFTHGQALDLLCKR